MIDHLTDDKGNKWAITGIFDKDLGETVYVLQPLKESQDV
jgi:hypothetical protein